MLPLPMNEYVQENLNAVGFDTQFEVMEWNALVTFSFQAVTGDASKKAGTNGINISRATVDPYSAFMRLYHSEFVPPKGANWGLLKDVKLDELIEKARKPRHWPTSIRTSSIRPTGCTSPTILTRAP
jgi:ABC-type transport system substrate-binding protein